MSANPQLKTKTEGREFSFSESDFDMIAKLANAKYGLFLQPSKKPLVYSRLAKRLRALKVESFQEYCALLERAEGQSEHEHLLSALTTNVTHFFREMHHFDFLKDQVFPELLSRCKSGQAVRIWSSACSSGQEAYCIAATAMSVEPKVKNHDFRILATDIDTQMIEIAKRGQYPTEQLQAIPNQWRDVLVSDTPGRKTHFEVRSDIRNLISFGALNLVGRWPMQRSFDVIICRNAAIYFDKQTQATLWERFANALTNNGHLMIGHSERLSGPAQKTFKSVGITTYQKTNMTHTVSNKPKRGELE